MKNIKRLLLLIILPLFFSCSSHDESLIMAAGAGYKKPIMEICKSFTSASGITVENIFGNMQTVSTQVKQSGKVGILIGDLSFLKNPKLGVEYSSFLTLGTGKLVLAFPEGMELSNVTDLLCDRVSRISMPDTSKAIYGKAAKEYLINIELWNKIEGKIIPAATVPQVSSYIISKEVDAGFINLTDAIGISDNIGGYFVVDNNYSPIEIVAGTIQGFEDNSSVKEFIEFLETEDSKIILDKYGL